MDARACRMHMVSVRGNNRPAPVMCRVFPNFRQRPGYRYLKLGIVQAGTPVLVLSPRESRINQSNKSLADSDAIPTS
jgi:hypothetical protein